MAKTYQLGARAAWISDIHLGSPHTHELDMLNDFFRLVRPQQLYMLGDTFDGYDLARRPYWTHGCEEAVQRMLWLPTTGVKVIKIPGNHDSPLRQWMAAEGIARDDADQHMLLRPRGLPVLNGWAPGIRLKQAATYQNAEGTHLFLHGDESVHDDPANHKLVKLYDAAYYRLTDLTPAFNQLRGALGMNYKTLTQGFQRLVCRHGPDFITAFEEAQVVSAMNAQAQGVFCGHVHYPADKMIEGIHYRNPGSMQADKTVLVETPRGDIKLLDWGSVCLDLRRARKRGDSIDGVLEDVGQHYGLELVHKLSLFSYRNPGVDEKTGQLRSTQAALLSLATFGPDYPKMSREKLIQPAL